MAPRTLTAPPSGRPATPPHGGRLTGRSWVLGGLIAAALGVAYLAAAPPAADLAAAAYRSDLFGRAGLTLWDNGWYGGHHLPGYSVLSPALGFLAGPRLLLVLSGVAAAALFGALARAMFGLDAGRAAAVWFAVGLSVGLLSGRVPYYLGLAIGLAALLVAVRGWTAPSLILAVITSLASPVAGAFLALAGLSWALGTAGNRRGAGMAAAALAPVLVLALIFPEGGYEPFAPSAFWPALAGVLALGLLVGSRQPVLRAGSALYALALVGAFILHTPVGGNAARLGALLAGPLVAGTLWRTRPLLLALLTPALLYWQFVTPLHDLSLLGPDPSVRAAYYAPLVNELQRLSPHEPVRVEIPLTGAHWEARYVASHVLLARGWERQLDTRYGAIFYRPSVSAPAYRSWLLDNAVAYVGLPDVRLDRAGRAEGRLIAGGLPYLDEVWRSSHWRVYRVRAARPLADPPARVTAVSTNGVDLTSPRAASFTVRVRFSPYWALSSGHGCVRTAPGGWTALALSSGGAVSVRIDFSPARVLVRGARCRP